MSKDKKARAEGRVTVMALGNLTASVVDTMLEAGLPPPLVHRFLDRLEAMNREMLWGTPADIMAGLTAVLRRTVPSND